MKRPMMIGTANLQPGKKLYAALAVSGFSLLTHGTVFAVGAELRGSQMHPDASPPAVLPDPEGLNIFQRNLRSPTGLLYPDVNKWPELKPLENSDWQYSFSVEAGYLHTAGDDNAAGLLEYGDWDDGPILSRYRVLLENPETAHYLRIQGASALRDDQSLLFSAGKYGKYDLSVSYDSVPHVFTTTSRPIWEGIGTDHLVLPSGLTPGGNSPADILAALEGVDPATLALERDRLGMSVDYRFSRQLRFTADASLEWRNGSRSFGGAFNFPGLGQLAETVEPVDYLTHDLNLGMNYSGERYQVNLLYSGSFFRNKYASLTWENAGINPFSFHAPLQGRFALAPDNNFHNLRLDFASTLPFWRSRWTATVAYNSATQDERLIPPTVNSRVIGSGGNSIDLDLWNDPRSLSQPTADAEIEMLDLHSRITMNPLPALTLSGEIRFQDEDNHTRYTAFNPVTGDYGYIALDGGPGGSFPGLSGIYNPALSGSRIHYRSIPFDKDILLVGAGADYSLTGGTNLLAEYEREETRYSYREIASLVDNRFRLQVVHRRSGLGTLRASWEYSDRNGDAYRFNPYEPFYTSSLPGYTSRFPDGDPPHTLSALRKFNLADRTAHTVMARFNAILSETMDVMVNVRYADEDYDAAYGLNQAESLSAGLEWSYQFTLNGLLYAYYTYQNEENHSANIANANPGSTDPAPGGTVYPLENRWTESFDERNHNAGAGLNFTYGDLVFDVNYSYLHATSRIEYHYASPGAFNNLFSAAEAGNGFPDQVYAYHFLEGNIRYTVREGTSLRVFYRYEREDIDDYHYQDMTSLVADRDLFLPVIPGDYRANIVGFMIETAF